MFTSIAYAADGAAPQGGGLGAFLPLILIFVIFYFLLIRPQQKRQKQHTTMLEALKAGDDVITSGGIFGKIERVVDGNFILEIASGVKIKVTKNAVAAKVGATAEVSK